MRLGNTYFAEVLGLAVRISDILRSVSESSNTTADTVKELTLLCAELDFTQWALQNHGTLFVPTLVQCIESRVVQCFDTLSQTLAMAMAPVHPSGSGDAMQELFRIEIAQLRTDLRRLIISGMLSGVHDQRNRNVTELTVVGGVGGMGGPSHDDGPGGAGGNGEGPRLIADNFIIGTLIVNPRTGRSIPRGIHDHIFWVIDPAGGSIPISLRYCQTYTDLERIIKACLVGRPDSGTYYIDRGDYGVVFEDGRFLAPLKFAEEVETGIRLEISILQRQLNEQGRSPNSTCPHCGCPKTSQTEGDWYKCANVKCARIYHIDSEGENHQELVSPAISHEDQSQTRLFRRVHIQFIQLEENATSGDIITTFPAPSFANRMLRILTGWMASGSSI